MASYRFRFLMSDAYHYETERNCSDDLDALALAETCARDFEVEVWRLSRFVARVKRGNLPLTVRDRMSG
jgi:hypothetical protein